MTLWHHRVVSTLRSAIDEYRAGHMKVDGLRERFTSVMFLLEGDVPRSVHDAVRRAEAQLDSAMFYDVDVEEALREFEAVVDGAEQSSR